MQYFCNSSLTCYHQASHIKRKKKVKFLKIWSPIREGKVVLSGEKQDLVVCDLKPGTLLYNPFAICTVLCNRETDKRL